MMVMLSILVGVSGRSSLDRVQTYGLDKQDQLPKSIYILSLGVFRSEKPGASARGLIGYGIESSLVHQVGKCELKMAVRRQMSRR